MHEQILFKHDEILISNNRLIVAGSQAYFLDDINSIRVGEVQMNKGYVLILILFTLWLIAGEGALFALGGIFVTAGIGLWLSTNIKYGAFIDTSRGEYRIFTNHDREHVEKFVNALNATLTSRLAPQSKGLVTPTPVVIKRVMQAIVP